MSGVTHQGTISPTDDISAADVLLVKGRCLRLVLVGVSKSEDVVRGIIGWTPDAGHRRL
jgi:hypothetical protein